MLIRTLYAFFLIILGSSALAQGTLYDCEMEQTRKGGGYIPERIEFSIQSGGVTIKVLRGRAPIIFGAAKVTRYNARKTVIFWTGHGLGVSSNNVSLPRFKFNATIRKGGKITVHASPSGYSNRFFETGTCTIRIQ
ncbi:hypothetical protein [uncultured Roseobacter sp.]|uniref:hypothetical protein n=1 Tax=uncultured Roseobacter sp. TaxID=114847 RepID=UPI00260AA02E|nr:hypothetical protein [uncultured Roseobacter sp.]